MEIAGTVSTIIWTAAIVGFVYISNIWRYLYDWLTYRLPPGPMPLPIIGTLWANALTKNPTKLPKAMREIAETYGPIMTVYLGGYRMIHCSSAETVREALITRGKDLNDRTEPVILFRQPKSAEGLAFADSGLWQKGRRWAMRAMRDFGVGKELMVEKVNEEVGHLLEFMQKHEGEKMTSGDIFLAPVSSVICMMIFSQRFDTKNPELMEPVSSVDAIIRTPQLANFKYVLFPFLSHIVRPKLSDEMLSNRYKIEDLLKKSIKVHEKDFDRNDIRDFVDLYIETRDDPDALEFKQYGSIMFELFVAGNETSTTTLEWLFLYLTKQPEYQKKCQEAIDKAIDTDRLPLSKDRANLVFVEAVVNEASRIGSVVPNGLFHANLSKPTTLAGYEVPIGTTITYNSFALHHDKEYWGDPEVFRPERWIDENGSLLKHTDHFLAFGAGPRVCMGESLARVELFHFVVALLQRFDFKLETKVDNIFDGDCGFTQHPPHYLLSYKRRAL